ncbi:PhnD/SsuA/transferrin family substrate-binding protein, partial [Acinetobacter baumannii]
SGPIPFDPFVYRGQLCADIRNKIREVFLDKNALRVKLALDNLRATHFVPVHDAAYQIIRALP